MSTSFVETAGRVFRVEVLPDTPGYCRRTVTISVESGPPMTLEEYREVSAGFIAGLVGDGCDVLSWRASFK